MSSLSDDLEPAAVAELLDALDRATTNLSTSLTRLSPSELTDASLLDRWSRAHVVTHLANVAEALVRMTDDALADRTTTMYPGGRADRDAQIETGARAPRDELLGRFERSTATLTRAWHAVPLERWGRTFTETELGTMQFGRLVGLRLTEIETHHADLAIGFGPRDWSTALTQTCLPLRVASLERFRHRPDADFSIDGSWLLVCDDVNKQWRVQTKDADVEIDDTGRTTDADAVIRGSATDLTALLLGRQDPSMLSVSGDAARARAFKRAFPGP